MKNRPALIAVLTAAAVTFLSGCSDEMSSEEYVAVLVAQLEAVDAGGNPAAVVEEHGLDDDELAAFELEVYTDEALAHEVTALLVSDYPRQARAFGLGAPEESATHNATINGAFGD